MKLSITIVVLLALVCLTIAGDQKKQQKRSNAGKQKRDGEPEVDPTASNDTEIAGDGAEDKDKSTCTGACLRDCCEKICDEATTVTAEAGGEEGTEDKKKHGKQGVVDQAKNKRKLHKKHARRHNKKRGADLSCNDCTCTEEDCAGSSSVDEPITPVADQSESDPSRSDASEDKKKRTHSKRKSAKKHN